MNGTQRALAIALVIGVGLTAGFLSYRLESAGQGLGVSPGPHLTTPPETHQDDGQGDGQEDGAPEARPTRPVPTTVPDLTLPDLEGHPRALRSFIGRPLILNFWATWCEPCRREIPLLQQLRHTQGSAQLEIVGIAIDMRDSVQEYVRHRPIDYPLLVGEKQGLEAAELFGMEPVLPFSVFADSKGRILAVRIGELHRPEADFILGELQRLDRGEIELPQAREQVAGALRELAMKRASEPARSPQDSVTSGEN